MECADHLVLTEHRNRELRARACPYGHFFEAVVRIVQHVRDVNDGAIEHDTTGGARASGAIRENTAQHLLTGRRKIVRGEPRQHLAVETHEQTLMRVTEASAAGHDGFEDRFYGSR